MTQEEYKAMEMERMAKMNAAPLANQVFQPVQVTNVPPPPRAQEPQITPQQQQPGIGQQFGQALATKMITKGVDAVTGLPIMSSIGLARGDEVPGEYEGLEDTPDDYMHLYDDDYKDSKPYDPNNRFFPPMIKIGPLAQALPPGLTSTDMQILQFYGVDPFKASIEDAEHYGNLYEHQYGGMEFHPLADPDGYNKGGDVTYAQTGRLASVRAPLAKPSAIDRGTPRPSMLQKYKSGAYPYTIPSMLRRRVDAHNQAAYKANLKDGDQGIIFRGGGGSTDNETNWEYAQRTGDIRTPFNNVVFTPEKQGATISYKREDVKPFTWMWNKGRNFLGFGAPLAGGSK